MAARRKKPPAVPPADPTARAQGRLEVLSYQRSARQWLAAYPDGRQTGGAQTAHPKGYWFNPEAADRVCWFIEALCCHGKGEWAGKPFLLTPFERFVTREVFGWMRADGTRLYRVVYVELARKNGKTTWLAALGNYMTIGDQEQGAEVYSAATKKDQARICYDAAVAMVQASPELRKHVKALKSNLNCPRLNSKFEPLGADSSTLDGLGPHAALLDELHAHRDRGVYDVLDTGMGARRQPLLFMITTGGKYEPESIGTLQHEHAAKVLEGTVPDDAFFAFVCCAEAEDDWTLPATWEKANPNIGVSITREYLAAQAEKAKQQPSFLNEFLRKHLNIWTQQRERWIAVERWNACDLALTPEAYRAREVELVGRGWRCYGGLDLSAKIDLSAFVLVLEDPVGILHLVPRFWAPAAKILHRSRVDRVPYDAWTRDGWMVATPGDVVDHDFIRAEVTALVKQFKAKELGYDPWNATQLAVQLQGDGITMVEVRQGFKTLSEPSKEFEKRVTAGTLRHGGHPVLKWMVSNVGIRRDANDNIVPDKTASTDRIDGVVATIIAISRLIVQPEAKGSVYERRGVRSFG